MLLQNTLLLALIYRYTNTGWLRAAGVLGGSVAAIASVLTGDVFCPDNCVCKRQRAPIWLK